MSVVTPLAEPPQDGADAPQPRRLPLLVLAVVLAVSGLAVPDGSARLALWTVAATLWFAVALSVLAAIAGRGLRRRAVARLHALVAEDEAPCFATDDLGQVLYRNRAAQARFGRNDAVTLVAMLGDVFAHPSAVLYRLQSRAATLGHAREDVVTRRGHVRLSVHRSAPGRFLWRFDEFLDRTGQGRGADGVSLPMLVAGRTGAVLYANEAMRRLMGTRPRTLDRVFTDLPVRSGMLVTVAGADGPVEAVVTEIEGAADRREIYLLPAVALGRAPVLEGLEDLPIALIRLHPNGAVQEANAAARALLRIDTGQMPNASDLFEGLGRSVRDWIGDVAAGRLPGKAEVVRLSRAGPEVFVQLALRPLGSLPQDGLLAVISDATAMKTLEAQFVQSQKMQAIGQLAGGVAHDFNNLLTAISGHCDLLLLRHEPSDPDYADLAQIHQNANRAAALVGQLLAFSRKQTLKPERVHLADVLGDVTHLLKRLVGERVRLELAPAEGVGAIRADRRQLEQVLMNLVVNARDAMPKGGTIRIETEACHLTAEMRRDRAVVPAGEYALMRVMDQGPGIPADLSDKIFEPFFTTKRPGEGTGLGLSTAYGIIKQSGGYIFVDTLPEQGAVFSIYFPLHTGPAEEVAPPYLPPPVLPRSGQGVVLLVEDEAPVRAFAARALRLRGYTVIEAENAEVALDILEDPAVSVDVFVTDVIMPGLDGPSWVRAALKDRPDVRVVFVSGYAEDGFADVQEDIPHSVFLPKPFSLDDLTRTVHNQLH
ncbi:two-component system, cell cycle sensor histidine kinase and response regulator CckA [Gemmobacter megaterium]|uniref:histidine kinase n=1 Tax=Gemmobacter megaterium TaxID=1086013 RepID=A0A1N7QMX4_9RHOB|nr:ATP-binding protein [Gemmobacter megaterium]GGE27791.1 hybrid sensor histidine kinase/response regulator [Gemmobacter megaterium]SIT24193.1 two-component system, cell cycle sensor histidine kinase and response regulator CckA [Gemmobacter megaterium]